MKFSLAGKAVAWSRRVLITCAACGAWTLLCTVAAASDLAPKHYLKNCVDCHARMTGGEGEVLYSRKDRLVNDYEELMKRVKHCTTGVGANWDTHQIHQVVRYLNTSFYHFPVPKDANRHHRSRTKE